MRTFCIYCPELSDRYFVAQRHFRFACPEVEFVRGIHAGSFGIIPCGVPENPTLKELEGLQKHTGLCLSHYMVWNMFAAIPDEMILVLEDDAEFQDNWRERTDKALKDVPGDFDILLIGNSNCSDKPKAHVAGEIYDVKYPFCTHAYILRKPALAVLLRNVRDATSNIDILLMKNAYPRLKVYTVLPRIVGQRGMELFP